MSNASSFPSLLVAPDGGACTEEGCRIPSGGVTSTTGADTGRRFGGLDRLYGEGACDALSRLHVVVAGIGGVGTWCVEALARSGVGALTLVDLDHIAESNVNRQVHALTSTLGQSKVLAMAARVRDINPLCQVRCVDDFAEPGNLDAILVAPSPSTWRNLLVDCTDQVVAKTAMILRARELGWPLLVCGGAGGKTDPMALRAGDLADAANDALLGRVRQELRKRHGYPKGGAAGGKPHRRPPRMGISCLWFDQSVVLPAAWTRNATAALAAVPGATLSGGVPGSPVASGPQGLSCAGYGSVVTITATMGMAAADWAIHRGLPTAS